MNSEISWQDTLVSPCETFHVLAGKPLYAERYAHVLKYHEPGLAPVKNNFDAFHIDIQGLPAYSNRFIETFGFYEGLAAVRNESGWFHINEKGESCYADRYLWCGNFQEGFCSIRNEEGYFHINKNGKKIYEEKYVYVGDFKDGFAVVHKKNGLSTHINSNGQFLHHCWFFDLDVYHKGFARARDEKGWFHINKLGETIYKERYLEVEPFYNGVARVRTFLGDLVLINVMGEELISLSSPRKFWQKLSDEMVGFWKTEVIAAAVKLKIFDYFPGKILSISSKANLPSLSLERLIRGLWELDLVNFQEDIWTLTPKGSLLTSEKGNFLSSAAIMWSDVNSESWKDLADLIENDSISYHPVFKSFATDEKINDYHRAIDGYMDKEFEFLTEIIDWKQHKSVIGIDRNSKTLLEKILKINVHMNATLLGEEYILKYSDFEGSIKERYSLKVQDFLKPWCVSADAILLPKVLLCWPDREVIEILKNAHQSLLPGGRIYLFETVLSKNSPDGSLFDLNMMVETGGKLRFLMDWMNLFIEAKLILEENVEINAGLRLFVLKM